MPNPNSPLAVARGIACVLAAAAALAPTLGAKEAFPTPLIPSPAARDMVAGDFDGDGKGDVLVVRSASQGIELYRGLGDGTLISHVALPGAGPCWRVRAADLDGDLDLDAVVLTTTPSLIVLRNLGNGGFAPPQILLVAGGTNPLPGLALDLLDADGDGDLDAVGPFGAGGAVGACANDGTGTFLPPVTLGPLLQGDFGAHDIDNDGDFDVWSLQGNALRIHRNDGAAGFAAPVSTPYPGFSHLTTGNRLHPADVSQDGRLDFVLTQTQGELVGVLVNAGNLNFVPQPTFESVRGAAQVLMADIDGDAIGDLVLLGQASAYHRGVGFGSVVPVKTVLPLVAQRGCAASLNGDAAADVVASGSNFLQAALSGCPSPLGFHVSKTVAIDRLEAFDRDGNAFPDLLGVKAKGGPMPGFVLLRNDGAGGFQQPLILPFPQFLLPVEIRRADLDGDGLDDLLGIFRGFNAGVPFDEVHAARGIPGSFQTPWVKLVAIPPMLRATSLVCGDFDADGDPDLAAGLTSASPKASFVHWFRNDGLGPMPPQNRITLSAADGPVRLGAGRLDSDAFTDLVVGFGVGNGGAMQALRLGANMHVVGREAVPTSIPAFASLHLHDLDGDGLLDLVAGGSAFPSTTLQIEFGNGAGAFGGGQPFVVPGDFTHVSFGDVDLDGEEDFLVGGPAAIHSYWFRGLGNRTLTVARRYATPFSAPLLLDADQDGDLDLVHGRPFGAEAGDAGVATQFNRWLQPAGCP